MSTLCALSIIYQLILPTLFSGPPFLQTFSLLPIDTIVISFRILCSLLLLEPDCLDPFFLEMLPNDIIDVITLTLYLILNWIFPKIEETRKMNEERLSNGNFSFSAAWALYVHWVLYTNWSYWRLSLFFNILWKMGLSLKPFCYYVCIIFVMLIIDWSRDGWRIMWKVELYVDNFLVLAIFHYIIVIIINYDSENLDKYFHEVKALESVTNVDQQKNLTSFYQSWQISYISAS